MENNKRDEKREARRKRRIRSQIISYIVLAVLLVIVVFVGYKGAVAASEKIKEINEPSESINQAEELAASENNTGIITSPDEFEISAETVSEPEEQVDETVPDNQKAREYIESMPIEQKVAALFMISPEALTGVDTVERAGEGTKNALTQYGVSGLIYEDKNIISSEQFKEMIASTQDMYKELYNSYIWLAVKEEGAVNTLAGSATGISAVPAAGEYSEEGLDYQSFITIGNYLNDYGINMNIGICGDVKTSETAAIGSRAFGSDADSVAGNVGSAVKATIDAGVCPCMTGFVGRGSAENETLMAPSTVELSEEDIKNISSVYKAGIDAGAQSVMLSNVMVSGLTGELPCSLSPEAVDILRKDFEFKGVILTDFLDEAAITDKYSPEDVGVMAICAGADIIVRPADFQKAYDGIIKAVSEGVITEERINDSLMRIYSIKMPE